MKTYKQAIDHHHRDRMIKKKPFYLFILYPVYEIDIPMGQFSIGQTSFKARPIHVHLERETAKWNSKHLTCFFSFCVINNSKKNVYTPQSFIRLYGLRVFSVIIIDLGQFFFFFLVGNTTKAWEKTRTLEMVISSLNRVAPQIYPATIFKKIWTQVRTYYSPRPPSTHQHFGA